MLDAAGFALLVLTAESERTDGVVLTRQNVVHEAGLFQGWLGWRKAIALREDGCEEFSNIAGLGQILFPNAARHHPYGPCGVQPERKTGLYVPDVETTRLLRDERGWLRLAS